MLVMAIKASDFVLKFLEAPSSVDAGGQARANLLLDKDERLI